MAERMYWQTDDPTVFSIGGQDINVIKKGRDYARQSGRIMSWLSRYGITAIQQVRESGLYTEGQEVEIYTFLTTALGLVLDEEALIELAIAVLAEDKALIEENFDPGWLIDAMLLTWQEQAGIRYAIRRFASTFFGGAGQEESENNESDTSTPSEVPTDGQTQLSTPPSKTTA